MKDLTLYTQQCMKELHAIGIEFGNVLEVVPNTRAQRRWGQCERTAFGYKLNINARLLADDAPDYGLKSTIIHELLHTCKGCMNHGKRWKELAKQVHEAYGYNIQRADTPEDKGMKPIPRPEPKYILSCKVCGAKIGRRRMSDVIRHPEWYRHTGCGGVLERIK